MFFQVRVAWVMVLYVIVFLWGVGIDIHKRIIDCFLIDDIFCERQLVLVILSVVSRYKSPTFGLIRVYVVVEFIGGD